MISTMAYVVTMSTTPTTMPTRAEWYDLKSILIRHIFQYLYMHYIRLTLSHVKETQDKLEHET